MRVLVTGGAGYIGSHVVRLLGLAGHEVLTYDNLSTGNEWAVLSGDLVVADLADRAKLDGVFTSFRPEAVMHFAASIVVSESVAKPLDYYTNNVMNTLNLLNAVKKHSTPRFVFSSTAAVYGNAEGRRLIDENTPLAPINPYGASKMMSEMVLRDMSAAYEGFNYVALRYFNVAGADEGQRIGQTTESPTHLITRALKCALGQIGDFSIYGDDYDTPDGTCIRDYIYVDDLAEAHLLALEHLAKGGTSRVYNCGYGRGYSVQEVVRECRAQSAVDFPAPVAPRRDGDPAELVADPSLLKRELGWSPKHDDLGFIIRTALDWERALLKKKQK